MGSKKAIISKILELKPKVLQIHGKSKTQQVSLNETTILLDGILKANNCIAQCGESPKYNGPVQTARDLVTASTETLLVTKHIKIGEKDEMKAVLQIKEDDVRHAKIFHPTVHVIVEEDDADKESKETELKSTLKKMDINVI